ncbi:HET-domain-containing protein [Pyrenochaeta sp. DS3sAY3a]|nr:HET-domain-containing protein [Pyrenochaeta sp. DS3sAY3a]
MRLLRIEEDGEFTLVEYVGRDIPRYAILSHTWGADHEEVSFKDLTEGVGKSKKGYRKIKFCGRQASKDGLQYFWVDTCCIDKLSSAELSEAINSMYQWYNRADKCYAYLTDVSTKSSEKAPLPHIKDIDPDIESDWIIPHAWDVAFQQSRWFSRGWTLQELLAPSYVDFFSEEGDFLGDKISLVDSIHSITGIAVQALQGCPLFQFSVDERMSWAETRETKREEDAAYCLLGLFDIHMPLIYGEGEEKAKARLHKKINKALLYGQGKTIEKIIIGSTRSLSGLPDSYAVSEYLFQTSFQICP